LLISFLSFTASYLFLFIWMGLYLFILALLILNSSVYGTKQVPVLFGPRHQSPEPFNYHVIDDLIQFYRDEMITVYSELENLELLLDGTKSTQTVTELVKFLKSYTEEHDGYLEKASHYLKKEFGSDIKTMAIRTWVQNNHWQIMSWLSKVINNLGDNV
jgi:hypothetical protein